MSAQVGGIASRLAVGFAGLAGGNDLQATRKAIAALLTNPSENPRLALLVLSAIVLLVLLLVLIVLLLVTPSRKRVIVRRVVTEGPESAGAEPAPASTPLRPKLSSRLFLAASGPFAVSAMVVAALASAYLATSTDGFCAHTCHSRSATISAAVDSPHGPCASCHQRPGLAGVLPNASSRLKMALDSMLGSPATSEARVDSRACLGCHRDVTRATTMSSTGVRVSHKELLAVAIPCTECHPRAGHDRRAFQRSMSACITCHDGQTASAECPTCHSKDPVASKFASAESTRTIGTGRIDYPAVRAADRDCSGCHDLARQCDACHGVRMPHSPGFMKSGHARAAAFGRKTVCFRCHLMTDCGTCHSAPFDPETGLGGHANWEAEHKASAWDAGCVCHQSRSSRKSPICELCHDAGTHALLPIGQ